MWRRTSHRRARSGVCSFACRVSLSASWTHAALDPTASLIYNTDTYCFIRNYRSTPLVSSQLGLFQHTTSPLECPAHRSSHRRRHGHGRNCAHPLCTFCHP
jgi:hypothetical protein